MDIAGKNAEMANFVINTCKRLRPDVFYDFLVLFVWRALKLIHLFARLAEFKKEEIGKHWRHHNKLQETKRASTACQATSENASGN